MQDEGKVIEDQRFNPGCTLWFVVSLVVMIVLIGALVVVSLP